jgi:hypothetical protein
MPASGTKRQRPKPRRTSNGSEQRVWRSNPVFKTLRYRVLPAAARLVRGGRRRRLKIQATWPWAEPITAAWQRIDALPQAP